jgi:hypothetical protein
VVVVGGIGGEDLDLPDVELLRLGRELSQGVRTSFGQGVSFESGGITPSFFWFSKIRSRSFS